MDSESSQTLASLLAMLGSCAKLKEELRHCTSGDGNRRESVAEHCFQVSLFALLIAPHLEHGVDSDRLIRMLLAHDLAEAITGDAPYIDESSRLAKKSAEDAAMRQLTAPLPKFQGDEIYGLWREFEAGATPEAKCARALDALEAQIQHNIAPIEEWEPREYGFVYTKLDRWCAHDATLAELCELVKAQAQAKMLAAGIDIEVVKAASSNA